MDATFPQPPLAPTVSPEARAALAPLLASLDQPRPELSIEQMRAFAGAMMGAVVQRRAPGQKVVVTPGVFGGVPAHIVSRDGALPQDGPLLLNFHGGGFQVDSGSLAESMPIAEMTDLPVVALLYRLAPEHPFPAAVDDALAAYRAALETRPATQIAIFGTSAGAGLCAQLIARLRREKLPLPAAMGFFSGSADTELPGDIEGYLPPLLPGQSVPRTLAPYLGAADRRDPLVSPIHDALEGWPPTLLMTSTRDILLSQTVRFHLALRAAGVPVELLVYEGMPHAFWAFADCPETDAAFAAQGRFLAEAVRAGLARR
ncbi:MAG: alpha/beta hydrolase [Sphingomonas adhaesiva]|uniref:alpha/beta hydrolase n=1 Tax=Sphingomonas adhaesiva TaxID=28212 RepID=UPI002FF95003